MFNIFILPKRELIRNIAVTIGVFVTQAVSFFLVFYVKLSYHLINHTLMKEGDIMRIALVDDNRDDLQTLHRCLTENLISDCDIVEFTGGDEFLKSFTDNSYDLIVLDIYMGEFNGIEVAREIRKRDSHVLIAFGTTSNEFAAESYEVNACYYLKKPFDREHVSYMLNRINYKELELSRTVLLPNGEKILLRSILYADCASHRITLHCKQYRNVNLRTTFSEIEDLLCSYSFFYSPCKGIVVNFYEVATQADDTFLMSDGTRLPISRRKASEVLNAYSSFRFEQIRKELLQ